MYIKKITGSAIIFDDNSEITYWHYIECCEQNYADFSVLTKDTINIDYNFNKVIVTKTDTIQQN